MNPHKLITSNIISFVADDNYTSIYLTSGGNYIYAKTLKKFETELASEKQFIRISKSVIVNLGYVNKFEDDHLILTNNSMVKISRRRKKELVSRIQSNHQSKS